MSQDGRHFMLNTWEREALEAAAAESVARPVGMASSRKGSPAKAQQLAAGGATSIPASIAGQACTCMPHCAQLVFTAAPLVPLALQFSVHSFIEPQRVL